MNSTRRTFLAGAALATLGFGVPQFAFGAASLAAIKAGGRLRIGAAPADPWFYKDPISETWAGVGVEIGKLMARELGIDPVLVETTFPNSVAGIQADQIDVMFVLDPNDARKKAVDFPDAPLFYYAIGALVPTDSTATVWEDFDKPGFKVGVTLGTNVDTVLTGKLKNATFERFASNDEAIAAFLAKRVNMVSQFHPALIVQYSRVKVGKVILPEEVYAIPTSVGVMKSDDHSFKNWVNEFITKLYSSGQTQQIFETYIASKGIDAKSVPGLAKERWS